ncbi:hypothetical protein OIDMADRAFT_55808 [Oidiodendron maius Zn]|uniref:GST N-terminal domain-containing protein n=1 Tax=Oidiodendron maius (strain Zn) TaxID=913774 RepID=A0A0C3DD84_OIDMZ|nr:hypothetical protein OIDMADRAFT_55808 [Oidiodendron maius Zn]
MTIELFVLPDQSGLYPRRVLIYLAEKSLLQSPNIVITPTSKAPESASRQLPSSLPILSLGTNRYIRQSIPIIEYFEDLCDAGTEEIAGIARPTMRGHTSEERARTREILELVDEATVHFELACRKGSAMFSLLEKQDTAASRCAFASCRKSLEVIEGHYKQDERLSTSISSTDNMLDRVNMVDCVLFALLQFSIQLYSRDLAEGLPTLKLFYEIFRKRDSAKFGEHTFPRELKMLASHFIKESTSSFGSVLAALDVAFIYISVLGYFILKPVILLKQKFI